LKTLKQCINNEKAKDKMKKIFAINRIHVNLVTFKTMEQIKQINDYTIRKEL
jgi:hypothetical protein